MNTSTNNNIASYHAYSANNVNKNKNTEKMGNAKPAQETAVSNTDNDSANSAVTKSTQSKYQVDYEKIDSLYAEQKSYLQGLQNIINQFKYQASGVALLDSLPKNDNNSKHGIKHKSNNLYDLAGMSKIDGLAGMKDYFSLFVRNKDGSFSVDLSGLSPETANALIAKAKEDVSEDGYWGVKQTSQRILDFAKAITGGDPEKMEQMRKVVDKAFKQVGALFGGIDKMPEISQKTYDEIMKGFDEFAAAAANNEESA